MLWLHKSKRDRKKDFPAFDVGVTTSGRGQKELIVRKDARDQFEHALSDFCKIQQKEAELEQAPQYVPVLRAFELAERLLDILSQLPASDPAWICGGFPRWLCSPSGTPALPSDVDIIPATDKAFNLCIELFIHAGWKFHREDHAWMDDQVPVCNLIGPLDVQGTPLELVQIVRPRPAAFAIVGALSAADQLAGLDFTVTRIILVNKAKALADPRFLLDELQRRLVIRHIVCPISSCSRISKYESKGYTIRARERVKLFVEWSRRAIEEPPTEPAMMPTKILHMFNDVSTSTETVNISGFYRALAMD